MFTVKAIVWFSVLGTTGQTELLHFSAPWCQPCHTMQPVVARLESAGYAVRHVNIDREPQLAQRFGVEQVPCFVMLRAGQEVDRVVGTTSYDRLHRMFQGEETTARGGRDEIMTRAMEATVRLRIDDDRGHSYGTGTIIDVHKDEALILTCGHIFRDSAGQGKITVDPFDPQCNAPVTGSLIGYDLSRDVALVSIRPVRDVKPVPVASINSSLYPGQAVFSVGCNRGREPQMMEGRINAIDRYTGPPNLVVSGQPVDGRSGGGLFTADGVLIGVCNAADPQADEGIYAAAGTVHAILDRAGLGFVYRRESGDQTLVQASAPTPEPAEARPAPVLAAAAGPGSETQTASLVRALQNQENGSEIICIVRSRTNPLASSQVVVLDRLSDEFRHLLAREIGHHNPAARPFDQVAQPTAGRMGGSSATRTAELSQSPIVRGQTR